jgi:DNA primase large subunit
MMAGIELGLDDLAKYPFLREAGEHVRKWNLSIDDLCQTDYVKVVNRAKRRVLEAIRYGKVSNETSEGESEILSFPIAIMLVKATGSDHLASRFSHAEAIRIEQSLEAEKKSVIAHIFRSLLKIDLIYSETKIGGQEFDYGIDFVDYLKLSAQLQQPEWKLVNRPLNKGTVYLKSHDLIRLIRDEIHSTIYNRIKAVNLSRIPPLFENMVKEISESFPTPKSFKKTLIVTPKEYPPCVVHILDLLQRGQNMPHYGRFLMTTYLLAVGKTVSDIVKLFPRSPDFNERLTRYQVEHIAGLRGGRVKYRVPRCRSLQTHKLCLRPDRCDDIKSPIQFGQKATKSNKGRKAEWMKKPSPS